MTDIEEIKDPLRRAVEILDKVIESGTFYHEIYKDKEKDRHLEFALSEKEKSNFYMKYLPRHYTLDENGLYEEELLKPTGDSIISFPGKYFYNSLGLLHNLKSQQ